jgi:hypothetical protein
MKTCELRERKRKASRFPLFGCAWRLELSLDLNDHGGDGGVREFPRMVRRSSGVGQDNMSQGSQAGNAVILVGLRHAFGKLHRLIDITINQECEENAVKQFTVVWITLERGPVIGGGGSGVALFEELQHGDDTLFDLVTDV